MASSWNVAPPSPSLPTPLPLLERFLASHRFPATTTTSRILSKPPTTKRSTEKQLPPCRTTTRRRAAAADALPEGGREEPSSTSSSSLTGSSARTQLDLLGQLTSTASPGSAYESDTDSYRPTIREQLSELVEDRVGDFSLPLCKKLKSSVNSLTISQKRNIKRRDYLNEVSRRNDSLFFATIGALVILPPVIILVVAILTGYVELFP